MTGQSKAALAREIVCSWEGLGPEARGIVLDVIATVEALEQTSPASVVVDEPLLTLQQVAERFQVHPSTVYRMLHRGEFPAQRIGASWKVRQSVVDEYLREHEYLAPRPERKPRTVRRSPDEQRVIDANPWLEQIG